MSSSFIPKTTTFKFEKSRLPEMERILALAEPAHKHGRFNLLENIYYRGKSFPIHCFHFGPDDPQTPAFVLVGGVHGLERIGTQTIIAFLESFIGRLEWDQDLRERMKSVRFYCIPLLNPTGVYLNRRSNYRGVDLMRNAPIDAAGPTPFLAGGHRIGHWLPWYRGEENAPMELESSALLNFIHEKILPAPVSLALDVHSGFGSKDRLWYPYASTTEPFEKRKEVLGFKKLFQKSYPNHIYTIEPQSDNYIAHGDLWDYCLVKQNSSSKLQKNIFIPWTLEMGSWRWIRKNPLQIFTPSIGIFHPIRSHRQKRVFRRHIFLFEFMIQAVKYPEAWLGKEFSGISSFPTEENKSIEPEENRG